MKKISIIIPVYKAESTLRRCIDSVLSQTYTNFELILVDDGSPDDCGKICDAYSSADNRIYVIHKANGGVSSARNLGIKRAQGEFITFIDSDDYVSINYLKNLVSKEADLTVSGFKDMPLPNTNEMSLPQGFYQGEELTDFLNEKTDSMLFKAPWGKLFKADIISSNDLSFDTNISFGEDSVFMLQYLRFCNSIATINSIDYMYFIPELKKYKISHSNYRYTVQKKVYEYNLLKKAKNINDKYIQTELHDITIRLFINELSSKYSFKGFLDFYRTFSLNETLLIKKKGGRLFRTIVSLLHKKYIFTAFIILRFVYPITLINKKRII